MNYWGRNTLTYVRDFRLFGDRKILKDFFGAWGGVWFTIFVPNIWRINIVVMNFHYYTSQVECDLWGIIMKIQYGGTK